MQLTSAGQIVYSGRLRATESATMNEVSFREMLAANGFPEPSIVEREAHLVTSDHVHEFTASALILDGEISVVTATGTSTCRVGDTFTLNSGITHHEEYGAQGARLLFSKRIP
jgi:quercetin dioxygenase-like cupin family protein